MTTRRPTEERQQQIADAALKVIAQQGLGKFTTAAIAAEVGITDGTLFRHFDTKEDIVLAALDRVEAQLFAGFPQEHEDPVARLELFFRFRADLVKRNPVIASLAFSSELPHAAGARGAAKVAGWKQRTLAFIVGCVTEAKAAGRLRAGLPVHETAVVVLGTLMAFVQLGPLAQAPGAVDRAWSVVASLFVKVQGSSQSP